MKRPKPSVNRILQIIKAIAPYAPLLVTLTKLVMLGVDPNSSAWVA
jgi:hypothetical protein